MKIKRIAANFFPKKSKEKKLHGHDEKKKKTLPTRLQKRKKKLKNKKCLHCKLLQIYLASRNARRWIM